MLPRITGGEISFASHSWGKKTWEYGIALSLIDQVILMDDHGQVVASLWALSFSSCHLLDRIGCSPGPCPPRLVISEHYNCASLSFCLYWGAGCWPQTINLPMEEKESTFELPTMCQAPVRFFMSVNSLLLRLAQWHGFYFHFIAKNREVAGWKATATFGTILQSFPAPPKFNKIFCFKLFTK